MAKIQDPIVLLLETYKAAVYSKDIEQYSSIYDEDVQVFDMWKEWSYQGLKSWRELGEQWFTSLKDEKVHVDIQVLNILQTQEIGMATALVKYTALSSDDKVLRWLENRFTCIAKPVKGVWKIIHQHTSCPASLDTLKINLRR